MHYCTSGIFFYETGPIILILIRKVFIQMCTIVFFRKHFCVEGRISNSDWYWDWLAAHMVLLSMSELILFIWIVIWSLFLLSDIYILCFNSILYSFHYWMFIVCFSSNHVCIDDINDKCSNLVLITLFNYLNEVIFEWINIYVYLIESSICLSIDKDHQTLHFQRRIVPGISISSLILLID